MDTDCNMTSCDGDTHGSIYFLARLPKYDVEKPYTLRYDSGDGFPATNIESEERYVKISSMRLYTGSFQSRGFQYCKMDTTMQYEDYNDEEIIKAKHIPETENCLKRELGVPYAQVIDIALRRRHKSYPIATGERYSHMQPTSRAHIDVTMESARDSIRHALPSRAESILGGHWQYVNVWHPLRGPLYDWPLAVCDASSVDFAADTMPGDVVDPDENVENLQVQFNSRQRWYYLPAQLPSELLIFKNADSCFGDDIPFGTPHAAFDLETKPGPEMPILRESIEMRAIVAW